MPYLRKVPRTSMIAPEHPCMKPISPIKEKPSRGTHNAGAGSVWQCKTCGQLWLAVLINPETGQCRWDRTTYDMLYRLRLFQEE